MGRRLTAAGGRQFKGKGRGMCTVSIKSGAHHIPLPGVARVDADRPPAFGLLFALLGWGLVNRGWRQAHRSLTTRQWLHAGVRFGPGPNYLACLSGTC